MRRQKLNPLFITGENGYRSKSYYDSPFGDKNYHIYRGEENYPKKYILKTIQDVNNFHFTYPKVKEFCQPAFNSLHEVITDFNNEIHVIMYGQNHGTWREGKRLN